MNRFSPPPAMPFDGAFPGHFEMAFRFQLASLRFALSSARHRPFTARRAAGSRHDGNFRRHFRAEGAHVVIGTEHRANVKRQMFFGCIKQQKRGIGCL
ncbi:hypothetical protein [Pseudoroseomonas ludipueritiae]|uniref:Uncharacterized protein n=1 Tax=Pseudoroseomonas ludipueritiae TaxID=198093 RepID=A0ABR7R6A0_9PROT|nr:hypothetical protein [Pseudoroseomonas ludipueritiae]MBC9177256.1 hypothetical protein [Pseudoroseomonas ludipueritiae]